MPCGAQITLRQNWQGHVLESIEDSLSALLEPNGLIIHRPWLTLLQEGHLWQSQRILQSFLYEFSIAEGKEQLAMYIQETKKVSTGKETVIVAVSSLVQRFLYRIWRQQSTPLTALEWNDAITWVLFDVTVVDPIHGFNPPFSWYCLRRSIREVLGPEIQLPLAATSEYGEAIDPLVDAVQEGNFTTAKALTLTRPILSWTEVAALTTMNANEKISPRDLVSYLDKFSVHARDGLRRTALHVFALSNGPARHSLVKWFLNRGAEADSVDWFGCTALHYAVVRSGTSDDDGFEITSVQTSCGLRVIQLLVDHNRNLLDKKDLEGRTPLDCSLQDDKRNNIYAEFLQRIRDMRHVDIDTFLEDFRSRLSAPPKSPKPTAIVPDEQILSDRREPGPGRRRPNQTDTEGPQKPLNKYFIDSEGIHREVLRYEISRHLGPEAYLDPDTSNVGISIGLLFEITADNSTGGTGLYYIRC